MMADKPTATEFVPAEEIPHSDENMVKILQATEDGGLEVAAHEPYRDMVKNHVYICDQCGHSEDSESSMAKHLQFKH